MVKVIVRTAIAACTSGCLLLIAVGAAPWSSALFFIFVGVLMEIIGIRDHLDEKKETVEDDILGLSRTTFRQ